MIALMLSEGYVVALRFSELCRDDAAWQKQMKPANTVSCVETMPCGTFYFFDVRGPYGRVGIALELDLVALLGYACT